MRVRAGAARFVGPWRHGGSRSAEPSRRAPAEETAALPAEVVLPAKAEPELLPRSALMGSQLAETWPPPKRSQFAETWPPPKRSHLSLDPLPTRMYGAAKTFDIAVSGTVMELGFYRFFRYLKHSSLTRTSNYT